MKCPKCHSDYSYETRFCSNCGTQLIPAEEISASQTKTLQTPMELARRSTFANRYDVIEELGRGGMGAVYRVFDKQIQEEVALKLLKPEIAADKKTIERFRNEIKFARKIAHRNVCRMYDLSEEEGTQYITMEYVPGEDLKSTIKRVGPLGAGKAIFIAKQVCEGLTEAHHLGVVHRDLKPSNIMIDKEGNTHIMDFGIARSVETKGITGEGVMIGTPEYMSPEQAEAKETDHRSDIYSVGVILYEMVTGKVPFEGDTALSIAMKHKSEEPRAPRELNAQILESLNTLILRCMEKDKEKRYQTAEELLFELTNIEKAIPSTERILPKKKPITSKEITVQFKLKKLFIPALVVIILAIIGIAIWQILPQKEAVSGPPSKPRIAVLPFEDLSPQKDQEYFCDGLAEELINALTHIKGLEVVARFSAFSFKDKDADIREICNILNTETVLGGSVRKSGNRLRITSYLVNSEGSQLWSEKYEREMKEVFTIQDEISLAIVNQLRVNLLGDEQVAIQKRPTENMEAYDLYLKALYYKNKVHPDDLRKGLEYLQKATEKDPNFALAYVEIGNIHESYAALGLLSPNEVYPKVKVALKKAMEIDDSLGEAHTLAANISTWYDWDWAAAEKGYQRAIELNPGLEFAHVNYATYLFIQGRFEEALSEIKVAKELNPLNPHSYAWASQIYRCAGRHDEAMEQIQKAMEIGPNSPMVLFHASWLYLDKGMFQEVIEALEKSYELSGGTFQWAHCGLGVAYALAGQTDKAEQVFKELLEDRKSGYVPCLSIANNYFCSGNIDKAMEWLEKAYEQHDYLMPLLKVFKGFDVFRIHPRGQAILKKMNLD
ncbi:MAG: protein kinase [Candidatus Aminicenantes bacterium]|nr:protein kinase [Candidatus Aminicenantes bacterium]